MEAQVKQQWEFGWAKPVYWMVLTEEYQFQEYLDAYKSVGDVAITIDYLRRCNLVVARYRQDRITAGVAFNSVERQRLRVAAELTDHDLNRLLQAYCITIDDLLEVAAWFINKKEVSLWGRVLVNIELRKLVSVVAVELEKSHVIVGAIDDKVSAMYRQVFRLPIYRNVTELKRGEVAEISVGPAADVKRKAIIAIGRKAARWFFRRLF